MSQPTRLLLAMAAGIALGAALTGSSVALSVFGAIGDVFLRLLLVLVLPLAASALVLGVGALRTGTLAGTARRLLGLTALLTGSAVFLGVATVTLLAPGRGVDRAALPAGDAPAPAVAGDAASLVVNLFPQNVFAAAAQGDLLGVLLVALLLGLALRTMDEDEAAPVQAMLQSVHDLCARGVGLVMNLAPLGVGALMAALVARTGVAGVLPLARFVGVTLLAMGLQVGVTYALALRLIGRTSPLEVLRAARPALAMAFATSSSAATLPTTLRVAEENLGLPAEQARFVLTVGATGNQNGTALFEGVAVLFLAQLYGVELGLAQQALVVGVSLLAGVGTAGVPGGSLPVIAAICAGVGVPPEGVGVLVGVDRFLDMCRTTLNVAGDLVIAVIVGRRHPPAG